jgi:hypothetical protein
MAEAPILHVHILSEGDIPPKISELFSELDGRFEPTLVYDAPGETRVANIIADTPLTGCSPRNTRLVKNMTHRAECFVINFETQEWALVIIRRICCACNRKADSNMTYKCPGCDVHGYCSAECRTNDSARHHKFCNNVRRGAAREAK